jgi:hypothetical protein
MAAEYSNLQTASAPVDQNTVAGRILALKSVIDRITELANAAERVASRVGGVYPQQAEKPGNAPTPVPNGLHETLGSIVEHSHAHLSRIEEALGRTEKALG